MKNFLRIFTVAALAIALAATPDAAFAQRRSGGSSHSSGSSRSSSVSKPSGQQRSSVSSSGRIASQKHSSASTSILSGNSSRHSTEGSRSGVNRRISGTNPSQRQGSQVQSRDNSNSNVTRGGLMPSTQSQSSGRQLSGTSHNRSDNTHGQPGRSSMSHSGGNQPGGGHSVGGDSGHRPSSHGVSPGGSHPRPDIVERRPGGDFRIGGNRDVHRIEPRHRSVLTFDRPGIFFRHAPHYFGYRVYSLPELHRYHFWGRDYFLYNDIYYRYWDGYYVVCRPPFGVFFNAASDIAYTALAFSYYYDLYHSYNVIDSNYDTIQSQNETIARNNATIAAQNEEIALNSTKASEAYALASSLGLVQNYADASVEYYYEDGVFFTKDSNGKYVTIVPPAGALVSELPDDFETITLDGNQYYKVDDTVYRVVIVDGTPRMEVLGQLAGEAATRYDSYSD